MAEEGVIPRAIAGMTLTLCAAAASPTFAADDCVTALQAPQQPWIAEGDGVRVAFIANPMPVPLNQHFALELAPCDGARGATASTVRRG